MSHSPIATTPILMEISVRLTAIVRPEPDAGGYSASILALPGCHSQGETLDDVRANLREAAEGWLAVAIKRSEGNQRKCAHRKERVPSIFKLYCEHAKGCLIQSCFSQGSLSASR